MSAAEMQACLARLCVDDSFRRLFELEPEAALAGYRLAAGEGEALRGIDREGLARFAACLKQKRRGPLERAYPLLFRAVAAAEMDRYHDRFFALHPADPADSPFAGRLKFGRFMEESLASDAAAPRYASDLARYERLRFAATLPPPAESAPCRSNGKEASPAAPPDAGARPVVRPGVQRGTFVYDVIRIARDLLGERVPAGAETAAFELLFWLPAAGRQPRILRLNAATGALLDLCDGRHTVRELADAFPGAGDARMAEVTGALERLGALRILA
jgi:hypothetical protein